MKSCDLKSFTGVDDVVVDGIPMRLACTYALDMDNADMARITAVAVRVHKTKKDPTDPMLNDGGPIICYGTGLLHTTSGSVARALQRVGCRLQKRLVGLPVPEKTLVKPAALVGGMCFLWLLCLLWSRLAPATARFLFA